MKCKNRVFISSAVAAFCVAATFAIAQTGQILERNDQYHHDQNMMWGGSQWGHLGIISWAIVMILIVVTLVIGIICLLRPLVSAKSAAGNYAAHDRALAILEERYALGEIDTVEFEERKKLLAD